MKAALLFLLASLTCGFSFDTFGPAPTQRFNPTPKIVLRGRNLPIGCMAEDIAEEVKAAFKWSGPAAWYDFPEDSVYLKPTRSDLATFLAFFKYARVRDVYANQSRDCDDYSREALHLGRLFGCRYYRDVEGAFMIGSAYVRVKKARALHVLNFIGLADGSWVWFEPQTFKISSLEDGLKEFEVLKLQF